MDWSRVDFYWGDDRFVPLHHPDRNELQARQALLDHLPVDPTRIHPMPASDGAHGDDLDAAAAGYQTAVQAAARRGFDVCMLGVGEDGHIASLFPGRPGASEREADVIAVRDSPKPPPLRISLTLPAIRRCTQVYLLATGAAKAPAVAAALAGGATGTLPAATGDGKGADRMVPRLGGGARPVSEWAVVVPVKEWSAAKSRVTGLTGRERQGLALALATDTVATVCRTPGVVSCIIVGPRATLHELDLKFGNPTVLGVLEKAGHQDPLNAALRQGRDAATSAGLRHVAMVVADLPGLRTEGLDGFLRSVPMRHAAVVRDQAGTGTTLLASRRGERLRPVFGADSAARHLSGGARDLTTRCDPALRLDTDTWADLAVVDRWAGPALRRWLDERSAAAGHPSCCNDAPSKKLPAL